MPFRTPPDQPRDLRALIEREVRERIADAVDAVSLDVMVERRRRQGLAAPARESASDRAEFTAGVRAFLERLGAELLPPLAPDQQRRVAEATRQAGPDVIAGMLAIQVTLARELPDYWQRFDAVRLAFTGDRRR